MTEKIANMLKELNYRHGAVITGIESIKVATELWSGGSLSETLTEKQYKNCLTVISMALEDLQHEELEPMLDLFDQIGQEQERD